MPTINYAFREIVCKIVYYGPGLGGKTTNLQFVHGNVPQKHRGELVSLATEQDRTLFFDFLPLDIGDVKGFKTKFQLYTVPGQVFYNATRKLVLRSCDGVAFVADSQASRRKDNIDSLNNLIENLREHDLDLDSVPFVMQYNKRDMPDALPLDVLRKDLNPDGKFVEFEAVAIDGTGVRETLRDLSSQILKKLNSTANIVSDEEVVGERLGLMSSIVDDIPAPGVAPVAGGGAVAGAGGGVAGAAQQAAGAPISLSPKGAPELNLTQVSRLQWNGLGIGGGQIDVSCVCNDQGEFDYTLTSEHKVFGMKRSLLRTLKYVGEDRKVVNGQERSYFVLRDTSRDAAPISVFVEKTGRNRVYMFYRGIAGEIKVGPQGEAIVI